jgi:hypothetical protein
MDRQGAELFKANPAPACRKAQKNAVYGFFIHIQRPARRGSGFPNAAAPSFQPTKKGCTKGQTGGIIETAVRRSFRLRMEAMAPYAGGGCSTTLPLLCTFCALLPDYTAFCHDVKQNYFSYGKENAREFS